MTILREQPLSADTIAEIVDSKRPMPTRAGDIVIRHDDNSPSVWFVSRVREHGDQGGPEPVIVSTGRAALRTALDLSLRASRFFQIDDAGKWIELPM